jgi:hypothetical protein
MAFIYSAEEFQKRQEEYPGKLQAWLETNPEPRHCEWGSPEFFEWFESNKYAKPLNESDLNAYDIFSLPHMVQIREYLTTVSSTIPVFYQFTHEPIEMTSSSLKRFVKGSHLVLGCSGCCGSGRPTEYYLDSTTGKIMKVRSIDNDDEDQENEETSIYAESFQNYMVDLINKRRRDIWARNKPSEPIDPKVYAINYNVLRIMAGLPGLAYT